MTGRIIATGVVVFWVAMMTWLVRTEFGGPLAGSEVPTEVVLRKIFSQETPARLNVFYQDPKRPIGFCKVDISPEARWDGELDGAGSPTRYRVNTELMLRMGIMGMPTRLHVMGNTIFNDAYQIETFRINANLGEGRLDVRGDSASQRVKVTFFIGELQDEREIDFSQLQNAGLASAFGLPGLANFSFLGGGGLPTAFVGKDGATGDQAVTTVRLSSLEIAGEPEQTYLVESRMDQTMWTKIWVSKQGEVLKVDTSFQLTMLADTLTEIESRYPDIPDALP